MQLIFAASEILRMPITKILREAVLECLQSLYNKKFTGDDFQVSQTKPEFDGDYTVVLFSLVKSLKKSPEVLGKELGDTLTEKHSFIFSNYNIIKGFLNLTVIDTFLLEFLEKNHTDEEFGKQESNGKKIMVEYSSPNTNKPLAPWPFKE